MKLEIEKMLIISTGHISAKDMENLTTTDPHPYPYTVLPTEYGAIISLTSDMVIPPKEQSIAFISGKEIEPWVKEYSPEFLDILRLAKAKDCTWINFDCDGSEYAELPKFNW